MTPRDLQFDLRKNPDSPRVHGLRVAVNGLSNAGQKEVPSGEETPPGSLARMHNAFELPLSNALLGPQREEETAQVAC